jgi:hypothetical protein
MDKFIVWSSLYRHRKVEATAIGRSDRLTLITSIGVVIPCEVAAQIPPAAKYLQSSLDISSLPPRIVKDLRLEACLDTSLDDFELRGEELAAELADMW